MTKTEMKKKLSGILNGYSVGDKITDERHIQILKCLIKRHPESDVKIGCGIDYFYVDRTKFNKCFWLWRLDGSCTDFSFHQCISPNTHKYKVLNALRSEIEYQLGSSRTGSKTHIHHVIPIKKLIADFLKKENITIDEIQLSEHKDKSCRDEILDRELSQRWRNYHCNNAVLEEVTPQQHKKIHARKSKKEQFSQMVEKLDIIKE